MAHTCNASGCSNPVFSNNFCRLHQWMRRDDAYQRQKQFKKQHKIPKRSEKRGKDERHYKEQAKEFFDEAVKNGTNDCVFCGKKVTKYEGLHHLKGRTNDYLLDKVWWRVVHGECHVDNYHQADYAHISKQLWYNDFLKRLKIADEELYRKELNKRDKVNKLNPEIDFENNDD